jgi:hypothetical protein
VFAVQEKMKTSLQALKTILETNVAEIRFARRRPKAGHPAQRHMICSNDKRFLSTAAGRITLNFRPVTNTKPVPYFNRNSKNVLNVWDIIMQDYRNISMDNCDLVQIIPSDKFWDFFEKNLAILSTGEKMRYMDS